MKIILIFLVIVTMFTCKKKSGIVYTSPILSYVISDKAIPIYSEPDFKSKILVSKSIDSELKLLEHGIINKAFEKIKWFKVSLGEQLGYLSELSLEKKEIVVLEDVTPYESIVNASSLRIRKSPSLNSGILASVSENTPIQVIAHGKNPEFIDNKNDIWVKVKLQDGKIGFCFKGFLNDGLDKSIGEEIGFGLVLIKSKLNLLIHPKGEIISEETNNQIKDDGIYPVKSTAIVNGKKFFHIKEKFFSCEQFECYSNSEIDFWILEKDVEHHKKTLSELTEEKFGFKDKEMLGLIKKTNSDFDVRNIKITKLGKVKSGDEFFLTEINFDTDWVKSSSNYLTKIFMKSKDSYLEIHSGNSSQNSVKLHDFNSDGINELIFESYGRMSSETVIYVINNNKLEKVLELTSGEVYSENANDTGSMGSFEIKDNHIIYKEENYDTKKETITKYIFKNNSFVKL